MQHDDVVRTHAAERYLLGEMTAAERDAFEDHFFTCEACGRDVTDAAAFVDNARGALARAASRPAAPGLAPPRIERAAKAGWRPSLPRWPRSAPALGAAAAVLLAIVSYQNLAVIPGLERELALRDAPHAVPTVALRSAARGGGPRLTVGPAAPYAVLQADVIPERPVARYTASLVTSSGREAFRTSIDAPQPGVPVTLLIPVRTLSPGDYTLLIREDSQAGDEVGRFAFALERE